MPNKLKVEYVSIDEKAYAHNYYLKNKEKIAQKHKEYAEKNKEKIKEQKHKWYVEHKKEVMDRIKQYNTENPEKKKNWGKKYRESNQEYIQNYKEKNKQHLKKYHNNYMKNKMANDKIFKIKALIRGNIYNAFRRKNMIKNEQAEKILGCDIDSFTDHLLKTFKDRYGYDYDGIEEVHIDHIKPLKNAKTEEQVIELCKYTNLQLLKAHDNLVKWASNE